MPIPEEFLYRLTTSCRIETIAADYVHLKRSGSNFKCLCPFHSEKSASCVIYPETNSFYCFGCGVGGSVINWVMKIENLTFHEAVEKLALRAGMQMPSDSKDGNYITDLRKKVYEINRLSANFYYKNLLTGPDRSGLEYFMKRQLTPATIKKYGLGFAPDSWNELYNYLKSKKFTDKEILAAGVCKQSNKGNIYDIFRNRVMFPVVNASGKVIALGGRVLDDSKPKYINSPETLVFNKSENCFSMNFAKNSPSKVLILAEGYMDVISMNQAGFENTIATLGTSITPGHARLIKNHADTVVIAYDSDGPGQRATQKAINCLSDAGVNTRILHMTGAKDPDEYIKKFGAERFRRLVNNADDAWDFKIEKCKEGLDLNSDSDKIKFINKSSAVIAEINQAVAREVYILKVAHETGFPTEMLENQVDHVRRQNQRNKKQEEWKEISNPVIAQTGTVNSINSMHMHRNHRTRSEKAQLEIIYFLAEENDYRDKILKNITPEMFTNKNYRKIFEVVKEIVISDIPFTTGACNLKLDENEMSVLSETLNRNRMLNQTEDGLNESIKILKEEAEKSDLADNGDFSDEMLMKIWQKKKSK